MDNGEGYSSGKTTGGKVGCVVAAVLGLAFAFVATGFSLLSCPRDGDCQTEAQLFFWGGLLAGALVAGGIGLFVRTIVNRGLQGHRGD